MAIAFVFPGQGSQAVGMGKALADAFPQAREVFARVDAALSQPLSRLMFDGPEAELTATANAQPALMAVSLAVVRVLEAETAFKVADATFVAGHSLGEYSALAAAGALDLETAARLLRLRGEAMQRAVPAGAGAMAALLGVDEDQARAIAAEAAQGDVCDVANDNGGGQIVISGTAAAVERAVAGAKARGVRRAVMLQVSAPFHCRLMAPAAVVMRDALAGADIREPVVPVVANMLARPISAPADIRVALVDQICGTVRWRESVDFMARAGVTEFIEVGAGKVLSGLVKRIAPEAVGRSVGTPDEVAALASR
ncbi:ACP S-malonyltransferase [Lichenifustis flavocetrariae]|uniref:Malonyl CoA-acyl carrier protein transacylase n=1 Tax=Lichenifustis flavocetrariae TaxID=2949735 RepID=A0AA42CM72_9HYPH|nr:ACP S-malonyltransferase [Lichenifustis flavocetrariae]MCW6508060.1 ACP S-malonyltransferase [Lichenifustis flavocetrariae]